MENKRWVILFILLVAVRTVGHVRAQTDCPYAEFRLDTDLEVDTEAICEAAQPWAEAGFRVLILLTDERTSSQDAWFAYLDEAEADAGLRDLSQADAFDTNGIAFEASTATDQPWGQSVTLGERLFDTPLDTDVVIGRIKGQMRNDIAAGDPTEAFVQALSGSYKVIQPILTPTPQVTEIDPSPEMERAQAAPTDQPEQAQAARPIFASLRKLVVLAPIVMLGVICAGGMGFGGYKLVTWLIRRRRLKSHLDALRSRTSNLLNSCEPLLRGDSPQDTVLYQLFSAYGGEQDADLRKDVREWLRRSRGALDDAFDLRKKLIDPEVQKSRSIEQQVQDWEMLYVTFAGNSERILSLTDAQLRTLLDPILVLDREKADVKLTEQLDGIRRELGGDLPLKVELMMVDPADTDAEGILGYLDQVKAAIAYARDAREEAPRKLKEAQKRRQAAEENLPDPFEMTDEEFFVDWDERLAKAQLALEKKKFVDALEQADDVVRDLETIERFLEALSQHRERRTQIDSITAQGYRPATLEADLAEVEQDTETVAQAVAAGDYDKATVWIDELEADSKHALSGAEEWRALHEQNGAKLEALGEKLDQVAEYLKAEAEPAWEKLRDYPEGNWSDVGAGMEEAKKTLPRVREQMGQIERLNDLEEQKLIEAEDALAQAEGDLADSKLQLQAIVNRLAEVQAAEKEIEEGLRQAEADFEKAKTLRDEEDVKISAEVDQQIEEARERLSEGQKLAQARNFVAAIAAQAAARKLATAAYKSASEQVEEINALQEEVEQAAQKARSRVERGRTELGELLAAARSKNTDDLVAEASDVLSKAEKALTSSASLEDRALAKALRSAVDAYQETNQQANQALNRIRNDRRAYDDRLKAAQNAWNSAQRDIQRAEAAVRDRDAHRAGRHALNRAQDALPSSRPTQGMAPSTLERIRQQAQKAERYADQARSQARREIRKAEQKRARRERQARLESKRYSSSSSSRRRSSSSSSRRRRTSRSSSRRSSTGRSRRR
jgi:DNA repair exonuclease SbcCD ATPase subunit